MSEFWGEKRKSQNPDELKQVIELWDINWKIWEKSAKIVIFKLRKQKKVSIVRYKLTYTDIKNSEKKSEFAKWKPIIKNKKKE